MDSAIWKSKGLSSLTTSIRLPFSLMGLYMLPSFHWGRLKRLRTVIKIKVVISLSEVTCGYFQGYVTLHCPFYFYQKGQSSLLSKKDILYCTRPQNTHPTQLKITDFEIYSSRCKRLVPFISKTSSEGLVSYCDFLFSIYVNKGCTSKTNLVFLTFYKQDFSFIWWLLWR